MSAASEASLPARLLAAARVTRYRDLTGTLLLMSAFLVVVAVPFPGRSVIRILVGLPCLLFVPGYALTALLYPAEGLSDAPQRLALAMGLSFGIVSLVGTALNFTPIGIQLFPTVVIVWVVTAGLVYGASYRRNQRSEPPQSTHSSREWSEARTTTTSDDGRRSLLLNGAVALSLVFALGAAGVVAFVPSPGTPYTEFYLLTQNENGRFVADDYPTDITVGENRRMYVGVTNEENRQMNYTIIVEIQRVRTSGDETTVVLTREIDRMTVRLEDGQRWRSSHEMPSRVVGEDLRLTYLLFRGQPPAETNSETAYRTAHLWIDFSREGNAESQSQTAQQSTDVETTTSERSTDATTAVTQPTTDTATPTPQPATDAATRTAQPVDRITEPRFPPSDDTTHLGSNSKYL